MNQDPMSCESLNCIYGEKGKRNWKSMKQKETNRFSPYKKDGSVKTITISSSEGCVKYIFKKFLNYFRVDWWLPQNKPQVINEAFDLVLPGAETYPKSSVSTRDLLLVLTLTIVLTRDQNH